MQWDFLFPFFCSLMFKRQETQNKHLIYSLNGGDGRIIDSWVHWSRVFAYMLCVNSVVEVGVDGSKAIRIWDLHSPLYVITNFYWALIVIT